MDLVQKVRQLVSKKKKRFQDDKFDLDLTYITENIIAMGWPSTGVEELYRNPMSAIIELLNERHKEHFKVYNLCEERFYDADKFASRVEVFPFPDHNPPPLFIMRPFCNNVQKWLTADPKNVAVIHCKAGKGRTGTMIAAYMLHDGTFRSAEKSLTFFGSKRTLDGKGVTINSQKRYVHYYERCLKRGFPKLDIKLIVKSIRILPGPLFACTPQLTIFSNTKDEVYDSAKHHTTTYKAECDVIEFSNINISVKGDVKIVIFEAKKKEKMFHFWFNTNMLDDNKFVLTRTELDGKAPKDKKHEKYPDNMTVEVIMVPDPTSPPLSLDKSQIPIYLQDKNSGPNSPAPNSASSSNAANRSASLVASPVSKSNSIVAAASAAYRSVSLVGPNSSAADLEEPAYVALGAPSQQQQLQQLPQQPMAPPVNQQQQHANPEQDPKNASYYQNFYAQQLATLQQNAAQYDPAQVAQHMQHYQQQVQHFSQMHQQYMAQQQQQQ